MAMLGFLVFLFYIIYNYLNVTGNANGGRRIILENPAANKEDQLVHLSEHVVKALQKFQVIV
jgi:hypothetical protein